MCCGICACIFCAIACCSEKLFRKCQSIYNPQPDCEPLLSTDKSAKAKCDDKKHGKGQFESKNKQDLASEEFKKKQIKMLSNQPRRSTGSTDMNSRFVTFDFSLGGLPCLPAWMSSITSYIIQIFLIKIGRYKFVKKFLMIH